MQSFNTKHALRLALVAAAALSVTACASRPKPGPAPEPAPPPAVAPTPTPTPAPAPSATVTPGTIQDFVVNVGERVFFDLDSYSVRADAAPLLDAQAAWLVRYPNVQVRIEGNADERGTREYNLALGQRRANAARDALVASGVSGARITTISYGKDRPAALGSDESAWAQNRRAVTVVQ